MKWSEWYLRAQSSLRISLLDGCHWARETEWGTISKIFPQCSIFRLISAGRQTGRKGGPGGSLTFLGLLTFFTDHGWVGGFGRISWSVDNDIGMVEGEWYWWWAPARMIVHTLTLCIVPDKSIMTVRKYPHTLSPLKSYLEILQVWTGVKTVWRICVNPAVTVHPHSSSFLGRTSSSNLLIFITRKH